MLLLAVLTAQAQIVIGGSVYGGGNAGDVSGRATVTVHAGDLNNVFGGARMANVEGSAFVNINGAEASDYIVINKLYGGNDIAGTIGTSASVPSELEAAATDGVDNTWNAFVRISTKMTTEGEGDDAETVEATDAKKIYIGQVFGGGNGDYDYTSEKLSDESENPYYNLTKPELAKTYLDIHGGSIVYLYGGGNNVTVSERTVISLDNPSAVVNSITTADGDELLTTDRFRNQMGINTGFARPESDEFQIGRLFGGNNKAAMAIRPTWKLKRGLVRELFSGGNQGAMTHPQGICLILNSDDLTVDNVYGGCRMADVNPDRNTIEEEVIEGTIFPAGYAARLLVTAGDINNVYGGNDVTGNVYGGNYVDIHSSIKGDVYGGGNGSYPYTDNARLEGHDIYGDFYYNPGTSSSVNALRDFRPNAESVSIHVVGTSNEKKTIIGGALYCGGNSATLHNGDPDKDAAAELKIGSYVIADNVFLGNNGENMVKDDILEHYAKSVNDAGDIVDTGGMDFSQMNLIDETTFASYMDGATMNVRPRVEFDDTYIPYSTQFGSFFCGGNVGSVDIDGLMNMNFNQSVIIFDKMVGGSNDANVPAGDYNALYEGGILGTPDADGNKLQLNLAGLKLQPKRWNATKTDLEFNVVSASTGVNVEPVTTGSKTLTTSEDEDRRLKGGNIYGGCYNSGHVNGNVVINVNQTVVDRKGEYAIFDEIEENEGEARLYEQEHFKVKKFNTGVILDKQGMDVLGRALNIFGGGYGKDSEIWGSTTINLNTGYVFQVFGGAEQGVIGKATETGDYEFNGKKYAYDEKYSCYINLKGSYDGVYRGHENDNDDMASAEFIYGGAFEGPIAGNTVINLGRGRIFNSFAGSCNADILGHTETYVGRNTNSDTDLGFPWVRDHIYGGNDLGGQILGAKDFSDRVNSDILNKVYNPKAKATPDVTNASAYVEYIQGRVDYIFGGCYGVYDYTDRHFKDYTNDDGTAKAGFTKPRMDNAFVNFKPVISATSAVTRVYGAGQGYSGEADRDVMQDRSYVLIDIPETSNRFNDMEVFGAGDFGGVGMRIDTLTARTNADGITAAAVIDLFRGHIKDVFGASYQEGVTRRTIVNVPKESTIHVNRIFGGGYGVTNEKPCDVFEANVNYHSADAIAEGNPDDVVIYESGPSQEAGVIYGGNNNCRRTLYSRVTVDSKVALNTTGYTGRVFGAGYGKDTWTQYTEVNLLEGANVYEVYGGGYGGMVLNKMSVDAAGFDQTIGGKYEDVGLDDPLVRVNKLDNLKCNTNVRINKGAYVGNYAYGGGLGADATVSGSTYIEVLGGEVKKDLYAGGTSGAVMDKYGLGNGKFVATANAYLEGGTVRKIYGGGWKGGVGYTKMEADAQGKMRVTENIPGKTNVVIGIREDQPNAPTLDYYSGIPVVKFNAYGGGEMSGIYGEANITVNNGYIGYEYKDGQYAEKLDDETWTDHVGKDRLTDCGNVFGGCYDDNSTVDDTRVKIWNGKIRNSVFGGGELATVGRGKILESGTDNKDRTLEAIYQAGSTHIEMYNGHVKRNVFGGGKGYNHLGFGGGGQRYTDGYVFGRTEVYIYGGEIGTDEGLAQGYGNVFGGGDVGYIYSGEYFTGKHDEETDSPNHYYFKDEAGNLTEDCKVVVSPMLQLRKGKEVEYNGVTYGPYDYVPTDYLNKLGGKEDTGWTQFYTGDKLQDGSIDPEDPVERGIHIHNAVFGGGNISSNSESYSGAITVSGNSTATLYDVFDRDFITVGTEHTGGLYGGGNLSVVGGYRELNITNYGTDYYGMDEQISLEEYRRLTNRERAYFKLEYQCQVQELTIDGETYRIGDHISEDEYNAFPSQYKSETYWKQYGFCSIYAGRLLNTVQRADFCGVYGSRLVLQGARDRVADVGETTEYTINRIGEVSLNQQHAMDGSDTHGNYFGIYNVVNYLGNLTSDVHFTDARRYQEKDPNTGKMVIKEDANTSYYDWKTGHLEKRDRNNGTSYNQVALASGVFLELTTEKSTSTKKIYGDITGIVELDLINVKKDIEGGGYVYARNEHGTRTHHPEFENVLLSEYNMAKTVNGVELRDEARTYKRYSYDETIRLDHQTSGNFIHKSKPVVDECYPNTNAYLDANYEKSPAHYWFIKGEVYIYDQVVSAYAGSAAAYLREVSIPLTITAGSNGKLKLLNVQPSLYAYYADEARTTKIPKEGVKVDNESTVYHLNDVITWWNWNQLSQNEQKYFVKDTYINIDTCSVDGVDYPTGTYVLENDPSVHNGDASQTAFKVFMQNPPEVLDKNGHYVADLNNLFRPSNNISHESGYVLTLDMNSPKDWDDWYSPIRTSDGGKISKEQLASADATKYREGPTYYLNGPSGLYGQREYGKGEIISKEVYQDYVSTVSQMSEAPENQAEVEPAYVAIADFGGYQEGTGISKTDYDAMPDKSNFAPAMVCISTLQLGTEEFLLMGELVSKEETNLRALAKTYMEFNNAKTNSDKLTEDEALDYLKKFLSDAYYVTKDGSYGGQYYRQGENYSAIKSWCALTDARDQFAYNYDAFDVLVDSDYPGEGRIDQTYREPYSKVEPVEYEAAYMGNGTLTYYDNNGTQHTITSGETISRLDFEQVRNDQIHYTKLQIAEGHDEQTVYIVKENFISNGTPYAKGQDISSKDYKALPSNLQSSMIDIVKIQKGNQATNVYYCYEDYTPIGDFIPIKGTKGQKGSVISETTFNSSVPNDQKHFTIQGTEPTETITFYVSRESNAKDVTSEKVITVVYQYTYYENDDEGDGVSQVNELHVVNVHLQMESGAPEIGLLSMPPAVLPGSTLGLKAPPVNPGLYDILTSGWELFNNETDAQMHRNGMPFTNNGTPLYWYQNQKVFLAFYSKTYLGKTYSNYVPLTVANYHDLDAVMKDKEHHLYVDHPDVDRNSKIYIDKRDCESDPTKSELDLLKDFFDLTQQTSEWNGHAPLDSHVKGGADLEFILNSDVSPKKYTSWTPVGDDTQCFAGTLHGDGYTVSGLNNSLFGTLCGSVYNLGVTGSFTSAGVVDKGDGYVENCWINTTGTPDGSVYAVFGNPTADSGYQLVNSYYPDTKNYKKTANARGLARPMSETAFYNGTVAFNLNSFYLNKRYYDKNLTSGTAYQYLKEVDGTLQQEMSTGYYPATPNYTYGNVGYVEERYADGDFIYRGGTIPESYDERMRVVHDENETKTVYAPIWPDDYLFFGQTLSYGYNSSRPHNDQPSSIVKSGGRLLMTSFSNRVYRAPAYYQGKTQNVAHFNLWARLAQYSKPLTPTDTDLKAAYPNMTAIDFNGYNDNQYEIGLKDNYFYRPLLDDPEGLMDIENNGETQNLLVYAPSAEEKAKTVEVLTAYFADPAYNAHYTDDKYRKVAYASATTVNGHLVQYGLKATNDHLLVDKQDFNCPISYQFDRNYRMWYQRMPDSYVDLTKGWETVSLPFAAELVTTHEKGEITHFYSGSRSVDGETKIGHEYWLREYKGKKEETDDTFTATFNYPTSQATDAEKTVTNTFLWDYYYSLNERQDANKEEYQRYYESVRNLPQYPLLAEAQPYIIGFPGTTYYEFDLSGDWIAQHTTDPVPQKLERQAITFVSNPGVAIGVSDDETTGTNIDNYIFMPNYGSKAVTGYLLNNDGDSFEKTTTATPAVPFRPYFIANSTSARRQASRILFDSDESSFAFGDDDPSKGELGDGNLFFAIRRHEIGVTSSLRHAADVRIVNVAGITVANFTLQPGETVNTYIPVSGVYIVHADGGRIRKKLALK